MTKQEFRSLCTTTSAGSPLLFDTGEELVSGRFVGCTADGVVIEAHGKHFVWPPELIACRKADHPTPAYS